MAYKYPICDVFHWFCKIARFFATEPELIPKTETNNRKIGSVAKTLLMGFTEINRNLGVYVMPVDSFKWKHYAGEMILLNVRWYLKYALSYRNLEEMMAERGVKVDHTTIMRWVHQYWFCCKKSGYFTKPVKNITNGIFICHKQVNNDTKSNSYSLKRQ
jgi:hypothetical protein